MIPDAAVLAALTPEALWDKYGDAVFASGFRIVSALAILIGGLWVTRWVGAGVRRFARKHDRIDETLAAFFASIVRYALMAIVIVAVLDRFGVQTTQIVAVLGAATLAIGLALQGTLSNVAAGAMLILYRPYRLGDFVELAGRRGTVRDINLFVTELSTPDNVKIMLPNGQCWGAPILNFTANGARLIELPFQVACDTDLARALPLLRETVASHPLALADPAPNARLTALGDYAMTLSALVWCPAGDYNSVRLDLLRSVKEAFDAARIVFPYPTTVAYQRETS